MKVKSEQAPAMAYAIDKHSLATRVGVTVVTSMLLAGCQSTVEGTPSAAPVGSVSTTCGPESANSPYGVHYGVAPDETKKLLGEEGSGAQASEWAFVQARISDTISGEHPPANTRFMVVADVAFTDVSRDTAQREAGELTELASKYLDYSAGGGSEAYAGQDGLATLHITETADNPTFNPCKV
jgi:hypothetical protein